MKFLLGPSIRVLGSIFSFVTVWFVGVFFGSESLGYYSFALSLFALVTVPSNQLCEQYLLRFQTQSNKINSSMILKLLIIMFAINLISLLFFIDDINFTTIVLFIASGALYFLLKTFSSIIRYQGENNLAMAGDFLFRSSLSLIFIVAIFFSDFYNVISINISAAILFLSVFIAFLIIKLVSSEVSISRAKSGFNALDVFPFLLIGIIQVINGNFEVLNQIKANNVHVAADFKLAIQYVSILMIVNSGIILNQSRNFYTSMRNKNHKGALECYLKIVLASIITFFLFYAFNYIFEDFVIKFLPVNSYDNFTESVSLLLVSIFISSVCGPLSIVAYSLEKAFIIPLSLALSIFVKYWYVTSDYFNFDVLSYSLSYGVGIGVQNIFILIFFLFGIKSVISSK